MFLNLSCGSCVCCILLLSFCLEVFCSELCLVFRNLQRIVMFNAWCLVLLLFVVVLYAIYLLLRGRIG